MLRFLSSHLPRDTLNGLYKLYVRTHLDYGDVIYHDPPNLGEFSGNTTFSNQMERIKSVQYSAALALSVA